MRGVRESVEDSHIRSKRAAVLLHGDEGTCDFWIYARSDAPRSGEVAGGNGKVLAARKAAKRSGCTAIGSAGSPGTGGEAEPQGAGHWHQDSDEAKQGSRNAEERTPRHDSRLTLTGQVPLAIQMSGYATNQDVSHSVRLKCSHSSAPV